MAEIKNSYDNLKKGLDKRVDTEKAKAKELKDALMKIKVVLETERKAYCVDMKKSLLTYAQQCPIEQEQFKTVLESVQV